MSEQPRDFNSTTTAAHKRKLIILIGDNGEDDIELAIPNKRSKKLHPEAGEKPLPTFTHLLDPLETLEFEVFREVMPKDIIRHFQQFLDPKTLYSFYQTCKYANSFDLRIRGQMPYSYWTTVSPLALLATTDVNTRLFQPKLPLKESIFVFRDEKGKKRSLLFKKPRFLLEVWILATLSGSFEILKCLTKIYYMARYSFTSRKSTEPIQSIENMCPEISKCEPFASMDLKELQLTEKTQNSPYASTWMELTVILLAMFDTNLLKKFVLSNIGRDVVGYSDILLENHRVGYVQISSFHEYIRECGAWAGNLETVRYHSELISFTELVTNQSCEENCCIVERDKMRNANSHVNLWALANAAYQGHLDVLEYLVENYNSKELLSRTNAQHYVCLKAITGGKLDCLKYLVSLDCVLPPDCCQQAAIRGNLEMLKYFHELDRNGGNILWDGVLERLIRRGHLVGSAWALENHIPFKLDRVFERALISEKPLEMLPVLHKCLCECVRKDTVLPCELTFDELAVFIFKTTLNLTDSDLTVEIVAWLFKNDYQYKSMDSFIYHAFKRNHTKVITWLRDNYPQFQWPTPKLLVHRYVKHMVRISHNPTTLVVCGLDWLLREGYPHDVKYYKLFMKNGLMNGAMDWAYNRGFSLTAEIFTFILSLNTPKISDSGRRLIRWLIQHDCPQDPKIDYSLVPPTLEAQIAQWNVQQRRGILN